jgi:hypothetical protein
MGMNPNAILYPGVAMAVLTIGLLIYLGVARRRAVVRGEVGIEFYRLYNRGSQPDRLQQLHRHVHNHFEVPPLFYAALLFTFVADQVTALSVVLAWLFVLGRCVHSFIHLSSNRVSRRFMAFGFSTIVLLVLWLSLLVSLLVPGADQGAAAATTLRDSVPPPQLLAGESRVSSGHGT